MEMTVNTPKSIWVSRKLPRVLSAAIVTLPILSSLLLHSVWCGESTRRSSYEFKALHMISR